MQQLPASLAALGAYRQFLCYALVPSKTKPGKMDKIPTSPHTGYPCDQTDPKNWTTAEHACATATAWGAGYGVGFAFTSADPFFFVDIDGALVDGVWSPVAQQICSMFPGAAMEVSQSGTGLHIFGCGSFPPHGCKNVPLGLEFYTEARFCALTGTSAMGDASTDHTAALHALTATYFPPGAHSDADGTFALSDAPVPEWRGPVDDEDLIRRALNSRSAGSAFGDRASFADLWTGNTEALSKAYPDPGRLFAVSEADAALAAHLGFWTGKHGERVLRLMMRSALKREKWDRDDYLPRTISAVMARTGDVCTDKEIAPPSTPAATSAAPMQTAIEGNTFLNPDAQREVFKGCVYVRSAHKVLIPGGLLVKPDQFRVNYGGYTFAMDMINDRTTRNAWEAFTESSVLRAPHADDMCFRPDLESAVVVDDGDQTRVNTYWPARVPRMVGDAEPFNIHLSKLFPNERDRLIVLSYMAAVVQYKGIKFQWCPVIQGAEGNGKSLLSAMVSRAIGQRYTHWPDAKDLSTPFNGWLADRIFIAVEELHSQDHQVDVVHSLLTIISGSFGKQIQYKGVDQSSRQIVCNLMCNTNYKTAIRKTPDNARRFAMFYTPQQTRADIEACGMGGDYFPKLVDWLKHRNGFAIVSELLHTFPIPPEFNPAAALYRAPDTSTTGAAIVESRGNVEQQIAEAIAQGSPGFAGGWVSSCQLDKLITETMRMGNRISHSKRRELLIGMGYILHPGLTEGRVNNPVQPDGRKTQLYIQPADPQARLRGAAEIAKAYTVAQQIAPAHFGV